MSKDTKKKTPGEHMTMLHKAMRVVPLTRKWNRQVRSLAHSLLACAGRLEQLLEAENVELTLAQIENTIVMMQVELAQLKPDLPIEDIIRDRIVGEEKYSEAFSKWDHRLKSYVIDWKGINNFMNEYIFAHSEKKKKIDTELGVKDNYDIEDQELEDDEE